MRGSTSAIIQPDGTLVKGYSYYVFGELEQSGASDFLNEVTFTGSVTDKSTGLQYMNARYYQPSTGRFISQDTYSGNPYDPWTQHLYAYCGNNPTSMIDPTGHFAITLSVAAAAAAAAALLKAIALTTAAVLTGLAIKNCLILHQRHRILRRSPSPKKSPKPRIMLFLLKSPILVARLILAERLCLFPKHPGRMIRINPATLYIGV
ncbi:MAG: RHS repeat-associated core domain-containing protein [Christensenellales bacterium]